MFNSSQKYAVDRPNLKCDYVRYTQTSLDLLVIGENNQNFIHIPKGNSAISLNDSFIEINFNVTHRAVAHAHYAGGDHYD